MNKILNKLSEKQMHFFIEVSTNSNTTIIIPLTGNLREMEIIEDGDYTIVLPPFEPFALPIEKRFRTEDEVINYLFKED